MTTPTTRQRLNGYVTWTSFLTVLGIIMIAALTLNSFVWAQRGREMDQFEKRMVEQFDGVKDRLNKIDDKLKR